MHDYYSLILAFSRGGEGIHICDNSAKEFTFVTAVLLNYYTMNRYLRCP